MSSYFRFLLGCAVLFSLVTSPVYAQEAAAEPTTKAVELPSTEGDIEAEDDGFSDSFGDDFSTPEITLDISDVKKKERAKDEFWSWNGFIKTELAFSPSAQKNIGTILAPIYQDDAHISRARTTINLTFDTKLTDGWKARANFNLFADDAYRMHGYANYNQDVLDSMEFEAEIRDLYFEGNMAEGLSLKAGRQIVVWGQSQTAQMNDLVNPRDNREMGLIDVEDARLPVLALNFGFEVLGANVNIIRVLEHRGNKLPAYGSEFDSVEKIDANVAGTPFAGELKPLFKPEMFVRMEWQMNGGDISIYSADTYDDQPYMLAFFHSVNGWQLRQAYQRIQSLGFSANKTYGSWLFRGEYAGKKNVKFAQDSVNFLTQLGGNLDAYLVKDVEQMAFSVEYTGFTDTLISVEMSNEFILNYDILIAQAQDSGTMTVMVTHDSFHQTWHNRMLVFILGGSTGIRIDSTYDTSIEGLTVGFGIMEYMSSDMTSPFYGFKDNDRIYSSAKYSF